MSTLVSASRFVKAPVVVSKAAQANEAHEDALLAISNLLDALEALAVHNTEAGRTAVWMAEGVRALTNPVFDCHLAK